ncbi:MAG: cation diffusion facilitator family transporter [Bacteroidota bacterium]
MSNSNKTISVQKWVTITGLLLLILKFVAYYLTHSVAILTDALESIVNVVAGFITLYSLYVAAKPRDAGHPYGHGKAEFLSAGIEGTLIFIAGIFIIIESIKKLLHPSVVQQLDLGIILIAISGLINFIAGKIAIRTGKQNNSLAITATGKHLVSDSISTAGLIAGLLILFFTKISWIDSAVAILFGGIIIYTGIKIVRSSVAGIMDESDNDLLDKLVKLLNSKRPENWIDMHNLRVIKYGSSLHLDCHITMPWYLNLDEAHLEVDKLGALVKSEFGDALELFVHTDGCLPFSCRICVKKDCHVRKHPFEHRIEWDSDNIFQNKKHELSNA